LHLQVFFTNAYATRVDTGAVSGRSVFRAQKFTPFPFCPISDSHAWSLWDLSILNISRTVFEHIASQSIDSIRNPTFFRLFVSV